jgi:hypothetical protein
MFLASLAETKAGFLSLRFLFLFLLESKWLLKPLARLILPVAVTLNRFRAPRLVLIFGILFSLDRYFGERNIAIFLPSNLGGTSTLAISWT